MDTNSTTIVQQATYSAIAYSLIGLVGIPANLLVLALSIVNRKQQNGYWILIANIALADAILLIDGVALQVPNAHLELFQSSPSCSVAAFFTYACGLVGIMSLPQIALNRYAAFYFEELYDRIYSARNCFLIVALMWAFSFGVLLPVVDATMMEEMYVCGFQPTGAMFVYFTIATYSPAAIGYPLLIWSSAKVWLKLREHSTLVIAASSNVVGHARQLLRLLVVFSVLPLVLEVPIFVAKPITLSLAFAVSPWLLRTLMIMFFLDAAVNPFVTIACMKPYATSVKKAVDVVRSWWLCKRVGRAVVVNSTNAITHATFANSQAPKYNPHPTTPAPLSVLVSDHLVMVMPGGASAANEVP